MMNFRKSIAGLIAGAAVISMTVAPMTASAQSLDDLKNRLKIRQSHNPSHRQQTKNQWRNLAIGAGAVGVWGLLKHDSTLTFLGAAGALYSANRYEQDRKSQNRSRRARADMFARGSYTHNGHRYVKKTVYQHGHKYYRFVRVS